MYRIVVWAGLSVALLGAVPAWAATFPDVLQQHDNFAAVEELNTRKVIQGYPDGTFQPEREVNRAEALAIILRGLNIGITPEVDLSGDLFSDVSQDAWFHPFVMNGRHLGIVAGYDDGTFRPTQTVNLVESLKILLGAAGVDTNSVAVGELYAGLSPEAWYAPYASFAESKNLIQSGDDGMVHADHKMTRSELAEVVYRFLLVRETSQPFDLTSNWYSYQNPANLYQIKYPRGWEFHKGTKNTTFWKRDYLNKQVWYTRLFPNSVRMSISYFDNKEGLSARAFFDRVKAQNGEIFGKNKMTYTSAVLSSLSAMKVSAPEARVSDLYVYLPNKKVLVFYGTWGVGPFGRDGATHLGLIYDSFEYLQQTTGHDELNTIEERMAFAREHLLVEEKGKEILDLFPDKRLIETDTIGVGTGPVDYYYSQEGDVTLKYERAGNLLLDIQTGQTTAF